MAQNGGPLAVAKVTTTQNGTHSNIDERYIFDAPPEIVCPVTQTVFLDPVLTAAGHAYERQAINDYLRRSQEPLDPLTRQPLANTYLTPVFVLKSRALEYRESISRLCVELACHVPSSDARTSSNAIRYLRRAVELCGDAGFLPQGLTQETVDYVQSHVSNAYDRLALEEFARGLRSNGYSDKAARVYFALLCAEEDTDRQQQAVLLKKCLECWQGNGHSASSSSTTTSIRNSNTDPMDLLENGGAGASSSVANASSVAAGIDVAAIQHLANLLDKQKPLAWIIDVAGEAGLGYTFISHLCEHLLFPPSSLMGSSNETNGNGGSAACVAPLPWQSEKEVLIKYTHVLTSSLRQAQDDTDSRLNKLEINASNGHRRRRRVATRSQSSAHLKEDDGNGDGGLFGVLEALSGMLQHPLVVVPCAIVATFGNGSHPVTRVAQVVPFAAMMRRGGGASGGSARRSDFGSRAQSGATLFDDVADE